MVGLAIAPAMGAVTFSTVFSFNGTNGSSPNSMFRAADGNYYGTTLSGGTNHNLGTLFKLSSGGTLTSLLSLNGTNGSLPVGLLQGLDGNFYGVASQGGAKSDGTIFELNTNGTLTTLVTFNSTNGALPNTGLLQSPIDGSFYGTTLVGGTNGNNGTVFQLTTNGNFTTLISFNDTNGSNPYGALVFGRDGSLYGTTYFGGTNNENGTVFRISTNGTFTNLISFNGAGTGGNPYSGLLSGTDGNLYGTTSQGSTNGYGSIFRMTTNGAVFTTLMAFNSTNGATSFSPLSQGPDGNFYGVTRYGGTNNNNGTLFKLDTNLVLRSLVSFGANNSANGANPYPGLVAAPSSDFYGTTTAGGSSTNGSGTIFKLSLVSGPVPPITLTLGVSNSSLSFAWNTLAGITYQLQGISDPSLANWTNIGSAITATAATSTASGSLSTTGGEYYRVVGVTP